MNDKKSHITQIPGKADNYFVFEELYVDSVGKNFRAVELREGTPVGHKLLSEVHPFLFKNPEEWARADVLCERIRHTNNPNLYPPEKIIKKDDYTLLVFPYPGGKTLAQIVEDASRQETPIPFDLAFSIAIAIVTMMEVGSSIVVKDQKSFHGFLTPDHIIIDYRGNIFLKCFGLWPLFGENETAVVEMTRKYGAWLSPEFIRREKIVPQSDFYYLGYILYRMLTGNYFSYLPGEDFESTFTSISFVSDLPSTDIQFLTTLINFFKRTLNPSVSKRFANIREFKNYILKFFPTPPEDFAQFKAGLAAYMKTLYADNIDKEEKKLAAELSQPLPESPLIAEERIQSELIGIPAEGRGREEKKRSKLLMVFLIVIIVGLASGTYFLIDQLNKAKKEQQTAVKLLEEQSKESELKLQEVQEKLKNIESRKASTEEEQQVKDQTISQLKKQEKELKKEVDARKQTSKDITPPKQTTVKSDKSTQKTTKVEPAQDSSSKKQPTTTVKKSESKESVITPTKETVKAVVPIVALKELTVEPAKISGPELKFPPEMHKTYAGKRATLNADLLIDEKGSVAQVKILNESDFPPEVRDVIVATLKKWKYKPPQKGNMKVKAWCPYKKKILFKYTDI